MAMLLLPRHMHRLPKQEAAPPKCSRLKVLSFIAHLIQARWEAVLAQQRLQGVRQGARRVLHRALRQLKGLCRARAGPRKVKRLKLLEDFLDLRNRTAEALQGWPLHALSSAMLAQNNL